VNRSAAVGVVLGSLLVSTSARAQAPEPKEGAGGHYVFGLGGAFDLELGERRVNAGGNAFFEFEAIEHWLEIEASVSVVKAAVGLELASGLTFKKPFSLCKGVELMVGVGPQVVQTLLRVPSATYFGLEGVLDFMFWPHEHFGFWVAPSYDLVFRDKPSLSFGTTAGPMIAWW
jgi:hypothetical protein